MAPSSRSDGPRVLVVDDSDSNRELIRTLLERDVVVLEAADGESALRLIDRERVDLVLLDVMMPGITGYDVSRRLREIRRDEYLPILLLTSLTDPAERVAGFEAGADDFISKPIHTAELRLRVQAFLRTRRLHLERRALLEEAQRLHDLKDDLAALIVHDLRNPLAALMAYLHLLSTEELSADARFALDGARTGTERLRELIDDLLQVRLLEDGAHAIQRSPGDAVAIAREAIATMDGAALLRRMHLVLAGEANAPVTADATLLRRAIENLLANAIRHGIEGSDVVVEVATNGAVVALSVQDTGSPIPADQRDLLFTKYGSVALRRGGRRSGHGLGLYLVDLVMRAHEGRVGLDDSYAEGTRVTLTLPHAGGMPS